MRFRLPIWAVTWIFNALVPAALERPYFHLDGYMKRYWILGGSNPKRDGRSDAERGWKRTWLDSFIGRYVCARLHCIMRSDTDRHFHDHPSANGSLILSGRYDELVPLHQTQPATLDNDLWNQRSIPRLAGHIVIRWKGEWRHRLIIAHGETVWSIFIMWGPKREWGFHADQQWIHHSEYGIKP